MALAVRVSLAEAERVRKQLLEEGVVDFSRKPVKDRGEFLIPVTRQPSEHRAEQYALPRKAKQTDLRSALAEHLTTEELARLKTAYDMVGHIAVMEIDEDLRHRETLIAETLLSLFPAIKTVVRKAGRHEGELRLQDYEHLAGEPGFETTVVENGVRLLLDIRKSYYSVRSATERQRIMRMVAPDERVLVMFSGIGPFVMAIAKHTEAREVVGVELNAEAHAYAERNIALNKLEGKARVLRGDVRDIVPTLGAFDRIVMPLPHTAQDFLDVAVGAAAPGCMIHLYHFSTEVEANILAGIIPSRLAELGREGTVVDVHRCGNLAPDIHRWSLDIKVAN